MGGNDTRASSTTYGIRTLVSLFCSFSQLAQVQEAVVGQQREEQSVADAKDEEAFSPAQADQLLKTFKQLSDTAGKVAVCILGRILSDSEG